MNELNFIELESCLNLNQHLIDNIVRQSKINSNIPTLTLNRKLNDLNRQRDKIIDIIEKKLNEAFI